MLRDLGVNFNREDLIQLLDSFLEVTYQTKPIHCLNFLNWKKYSAWALDKVWKSPSQVEKLATKICEMDRKKIKNII